MRLDRIRELTSLARATDEPLPMEVRSRDDLRHFRFSERSLRRRVTDSVAPLAIRVSQSKVRKLVNAELPWKIDSLVLGERFSKAGLMAAFDRIASPANLCAALVQGCWLGDTAVQEWMRRGVPLVHGVEIVNMRDCWEETIPRLQLRYGTRVEFHHAKIENVPLPDGSIDVISSDAVWEHVCQLKEATRETSRLLRPGGYALHNIGPLYYGYAGDHCSSSYGPEAGYDHLLLDEVEYRSRVTDQVFFSTQPDPNCNGWAKIEKFSFATVSDYLASFEPYFEVAYLQVKISSQALAYRASWPDKWQRLLSAGVEECDLLASGINILLRKRT